MSKQLVKTLLRYVGAGLAALLALSIAVQAQALVEESYTIEMSKGKLIRLPSPAAAVIAADPAIADVQVISPSLVYVNGKAIGETSIFAIDSRDNEIMQATISVTNNMTKLNHAIKTALPDSKVKFESIDGALVMNGDVSSPLEAENIRRLVAPFVKKDQTLVNMLQPKGSDQVTLMVRVAEVSRKELKRFGISWENIMNGRSFVFGLAQGRDVLSSTSTGLIARNGTDNSLYGGFQTSRYNINTVLDALEDQGLVTILAEPNLTAQSGQSASFLAGGQFPIPVVGQNNSTSITFQPFGVSLNFTPVVLSKDRISLTVAPEVSTLSQVGAVVSSGFNVPALQTRKASTTVELGSGQSFTIAGLLQNDRSNDINKFPFLGDVPVLGALFRSTEFHNDQSELVIIVTPYIVKPVDSKEALRDPTQGLVLATDAERILMGKLYKEQAPGEDKQGDAERAAATNTPSRPHLTGPAGYVIK